MALLFLALFNSILGFSLLFPIIAPLGRDLGLSEVAINSLSTTYATMQFLLAPMWGRRSERIGRKPVLLMGILGFAGAFGAFALIAELGLRGVLGPWPVYILLLLVRILGGAFSSATLPTAQALAADLSEREDRTAAMAVIGAAFGLGIVFGPGIGAAVAFGTGNLLMPIYLSTAVALGNAAFVALRLEEPARHRERDIPPPLSATDPRLWPLLLVALVTTLAAVSMEQTVAFYYADLLHLSGDDVAAAVGSALVLYGLVAVFTQGVLIRRVRWSPRTLLVVGLPVALAGFVLLVFAPDASTVGFASSYGVLTLALCLEGFGQGLALPGITAALSLAVSDDEQGSVAGLNSSSQALGRMLGPITGGLLYQVRVEAPYALSALLFLLVLAVFALRPSLAADPASD
jgi:MFS family permease